MSRAQARPARKATNAVQLGAVMGAFSDAIAFVEVATTSLDTNTSPTRAAAEVHVLQHALAELRKAYNALDAAARGLNQ